MFSTSKIRLERYATGVALIVVLFIQWIPIYGAVKGAVSTYQEIGLPDIFPRSLHLQNFVDIWRMEPLAIYMANSIGYAIAATIVALIASVPSAYALSRFRFSGRSLYLFLVLATQMVAVSTIIVPLFRVVLAAKLFDSRLSVVLISAAMAIPLAVWLLRSYFDKVPVELEEAAMLDGCSRLQTLWHVVLPLARPGMAAAAVTAFVLAYKQFFIPLVLLTSKDKYPALVGVFTLASQRNAVPWQLVMASSLVVIVPPVILFVFAQRQLVSGLAAGGLK